RAQATPPKREPGRQRDRWIPLPRQRLERRGGLRPVNMSNLRETNTAWEALMTAHTTLIRQFQDSDAWCDVSMREYDVLYTLTKHDTPLRLSELRDGVLLSQPALSRLVERLVERGLVTRTVDPRDRRAVGIALTPAGVDVQQQAGR